VNFPKQCQRCAEVSGSPLLRRTIDPKDTIESDTDVVESSLV